jgi:hypothetical protein
MRNKRVSTTHKLRNVLKAVIALAASLLAFAGGADRGGEEANSERLEKSGFCVLVRPEGETTAPGYNVEVCTEK